MMKILLKFVFGEGSGCGGGEFGRQGGGSGGFVTLLVEENGTSDAKTDSSEPEEKEAVIDKETKQHGRNHQDLVHKVGFDEEQKADDSAGNHPERVRHGWLLLIHIAVHCVDSLEYHADVDGYTVLDGAVEAVVKTCVKHVVDGGRRSDR